MTRDCQEPFKEEAKQKIKTKTMPRSSIVQDLMLEILLCLPVKALRRFRCLSQELCHEIDSPGFTKAHLNRSFKTKTRHKLVIYRELDRIFYVADFDNKFPKFTEAGNLLHANDILSGDKRFWGSCNGLLLLSCIKLNDHPREVLFLLWLCNPFTRECKKLLDCAGSSNNYLDTIVFGLGYDSIRDDYKIVRIQSSPLHVRISVFSLASNSWRNLVIFPDCHKICQRIRCNSSSVFAYGALHWPSYPKSVNGSLYLEIVSFDISKEVFANLIPAVPCRTYINADAYLFLDVLGGSLVFGELSSSFHGCRCDLYYVVKCGEQFVWEKWEYKVPPEEQSRNVNNYEETTLESVKTVRLMILNAMDILYPISIFGTATFCWESLVFPHAH